MESLKAQLSARRWEYDTRDDDGLLKDRHRFALSRLGAIDENVVALVVRGTHIERSAWYLDDLIKSLDARVESQGLEVIVYAWKGFFNKWGKQFPHVEFAQHTDPTKAEVLGRAGTVVVLGYLPPYFVPRAGQRVVQVWAEPDNLHPDHAFVADNFNSQLMKSTFIVTESTEKAAEILRDYRVHELYEGSCLAWDGSGSYPERVAALASAMETRGFSEVKVSHGKTCVLLYCDKDDSQQYIQMATKVAHLLVLSGHDVTIKRWAVDRCSSLSGPRHLEAYTNTQSTICGSAPLARSRR